MIADCEVKLVRDAATTVGLDRADTKPWPTTFEYADYGGPTDGWGTTWTPAQVNATGFGVALTPKYLDTGGNARAYVDFISAKVSLLATLPLEHCEEGEPSTEARPLHYLDLHHGFCQGETHATRATCTVLGSSRAIRMRSRRRDFVPCLPLFGL